MIFAFLSTFVHSGNYCYTHYDTSSLCPPDAVMISDINEINESGNEIINIYIDSNETVLVDLETIPTNAKTLRFIGNNESCVLFKDYMQFRLDLALYFTDLTIDFNDEYWLFKKVILRNVNIKNNSKGTLKASFLDVPPRALENFCSITANTIIFDLQDESYYPRSNVSISFESDSFKTQCNITGFALHTNLYISKTNYTFTFDDIPFVQICIKKVGKRSHGFNPQIYVAVLNNANTIDIFESGKIKINDIPVIFAQLYDKAVFTIPSFSTPFYDTCIYAIISGNVTLNVGKYGEFAFIYCNDKSFLNLNLTSKNAKLSKFKGRNENSLNVFSNLNEQVVFNIKSFELLVIENFDFYKNNDNIKIYIQEFNFIVPNENAVVNINSDIIIKSKLHLENQNYLINFKNVYFENRAMIEYNFNLSYFPKFTMADNIPEHLREIYVEFNYKTNLPSDNEVSRYLNNFTEILQLKGYKKENIFTSFNRESRVDGFSNNLCLINFKFENESLFFKMVDYPSLIESNICYGNGCKSENATVIKNDNFSNWMERVRDYTYQFQIEITEDLDENHYFDFRNISFNKNIDISILSKNHNVFRFAIDDNTKFNIFKTNNVKIDVKNLSNEIINVKIEEFYLINSEFLSFDFLNMRNTIFYLDLHALKKFNISLNNLYMCNVFLDTTSEIIFSGNNWIISTLDGEIELNHASKYTQSYYFIVLANTINLTCDDPKNISTLNLIVYDTNPLNLNFDNNWNDVEVPAVKIYNQKLTNLVLRSQSSNIPISIDSYYQNSFTFKIIPVNLTDLIIPYTLKFSAGLYFTTVNQSLKSIYINDLYLISKTKSILRIFDGAYIKVNKLQILENSLIDIINTQVSNLIVRSNSILNAKNCILNNSIINFIFYGGTSKINIDNSSFTPNSIDIDINRKDLISVGISEIISNIPGKCSSLLQKITLPFNTISIKNKSENIKLLCSMEFQGSIFLQVGDNSENKKNNNNNALNSTVIVIAVLIISMFSSVIIISHIKSRKETEEKNDVISQLSSTLLIDDD